MSLWTVSIGDFEEVVVDAPSIASARWRAAAACWDAGYGDRRCGPISLIVRGVTVRPASEFDAAFLSRVEGGGS